MGWGGQVQEGGGICTPMAVAHDDVWQKVTQYYKAFILQLEISNFFFKSLRQQIGRTKILNFCASEDIKNVKRQPTEWEKIFVNHTSNKGLASRTYKELYNKI